jgi:ParB family chromosome partitioning protein
MATKKRAARPPTAAKPTAAEPTAAKKRARRKAPPRSSGLEPSACFDVGKLEALAALRARVEAVSGAVVGGYCDPLGGHPLLLALLPIDAIEPTPFQRDLSDAHHKRLADVIGKTGRFLDPVIAVTAPGEGFWTPNGRHRLAAMQRLGARAITALVVPDREVAWQILALNTEKAHNVKERALEVIRIYRGLLDEDPSRPEATFAFYLEDPALVTLGICYETNGRFAGGAYHPVLRRVLAFRDAPIGDAIAEHEALADATRALDDGVSEAVERLKARGLSSPYLRSFVVARVNPLRFMKGALPEATEVLATMRERAARFNADKVRQEDLARAGGAPDEDDT